MRHFPFSQATFQHQFGIRALKADESIIEATKHYEPELAQKKRLLLGKDNEYFCALPESAQAQKDAAELICHSAPFIKENVNTLTGETIQFSDQPLLDIARHVQEDLSIVSGDATQGFKLIAGAIAFPSGWSISEKIGLSMLDIHDPVPAYKTELHPPTEKLLAKIIEGRPVCRTNWGVRPSPQLDQSPKHRQYLSEQRALINEANAGERCWFRVERQTLSRLRPSKDVLFTIHTHQLPVCKLCTHEQELLLGVLSTCPEETLAYKGILPFRDAVVSFLQAQR